MIKKYLRRAYSLFALNKRKLLRNELKRCRSILDLGCGRASPLRHLNKGRFLVGVDLHENSVLESKKKKIHDEYCLMDIRDVDKKFRNKSFDCVVLLDVLEHLPKQEGCDLIKKAEQIARKKVVIFTPNGFLKQDEYDANHLQVHHSGWLVSDLKLKGYSVKGAGGLKYLKAEHAKIKYRPKLFWVLFSELSQYFTYFLPQFAFSLCAAKKVRPQ